MSKEWIEYCNDEVEYIDTLLDTYPEEDVEGIIEQSDAALDARDDIPVEIKEKLKQYISDVIKKRLMSFEEFASINLSQGKVTEAIKQELPKALTHNRWEIWCDKHINTKFQ